MKFLSMLVFFVTSLGVFSSCDKDDEPQIVLVKEVTITPNKLEKMLGDTPVTLVAKVMPETATDKEVIWKSANAKVATVDVKGKVSFLSVGKTIITATSKDGNKKARCEVIVKAKKQGIAVAGVKLNKNSIVKKVGDTEQLEAKVLPENASNKKLTWKSSDIKVVTVDKNGLVKALAKGKAIITVTTEDGNKTDKCEVVVKTKIISVTSVELNKNSMVKKKGETEQLEATVLPENATNKKLTWESSDTNIATVNESGLVTALGTGKATITVKTVDGGRTAVCIVTVNQVIFTLPDLDVINHWYDNIVAFEDARAITERINPEQGYNPKYKLKNDELFNTLDYWTWYGSYQGAELTLKDDVTSEQQAEFEKFLEEKGFVKDTSVSWKQWESVEKHIVVDFYESKRQYRFFARLFDLPPAENLGRTITPDELKAWETSNGGSTTSDGDNGNYFFVVDKTKSKESVMYRSYWFNEDKSKIIEVGIFYRNYELFVAYKSSGAYPLQAYFIELAKEKGFERTPDKDKLMKGESGKETDNYYFYNSKTKTNMAVTYYHYYKNCSISYW